VLGKAIADQPQLVIDDVADIAYVIPGQTPYRFPDNELLEQPGLFRDVRDGTLTYTRLIAPGALRGYEDFFVIGAYTAAPNLIHSREPIPSLAAIKGRKMRANNPTEAEAFRRLRAVPNVLEATKVANAIDKGAIDGTSMSPMGVYDFGVEKVAKYHYLLRSGVAPLLVLMNRKRFESLPDAAKALVRKYSGERAAATWIAAFGASELKMLERLKSDPEHKVVEPSPSDLKAGRRIFRSMIDSWAAQSSHNRAILDLAEAQLATIRSANRPRDTSQHPDPVALHRHARADPEPAVRRHVAHGQDHVRLSAVPERDGQSRKLGEFSCRQCARSRADRCGRKAIDREPRLFRYDPQIRRGVSLYHLQRLRLFGPVVRS
jgi:TRAP-type transport system periplasmic protein